MLEETLVPFLTYQMHAIIGLTLFVYASLTQGVWQKSYALCLLYMKARAYKGNVVLAICCFMWLLISSVHLPAFHTCIYSSIFVDVGVACRKVDKYSFQA